MKHWVYDNWHLICLNVVAITVLAVVAIQAITTPYQIPWGHDQLMEDSGKWAIRFLLLCLAMTPIYNVFGWRTAIKLRKPAGLWAFAFALLHVIVILSERGFSTAWFKLQLDAFTQQFEVYGVIAFAILFVLAVTSNRWAMKMLSHNWKVLHRLVYVSGILVIAHAIIAGSITKRAFVFPRSDWELIESVAQLIILVVLLTMRVPYVKQVLGISRGKRKRKRSDVVATVTRTD